MTLYQAVDIDVIDGQKVDNKCFVHKLSESLKAQFDPLDKELTIQKLTKVIRQTGLQKLLSLINDYLDKLNIAEISQEIINHFNVKEDCHELRAVVSIDPKKFNFSISILKFKIPYSLHTIRDHSSEPSLDDQFESRELVTYKKAIDSSSVFSITDANGIITYVNDTFCNLSGYTREELIGSTHQLIKSDFHSRIFFSKLWNTISHGEMWKDEIKNKAKSGAEYWVDTTIVPFLNAQGMPYQYAAIKKDITKKKMMELQLAESEYKYRCLFEFSPIPMWIYDVETLKFIEVNKAAVDAYGYSFDEFKEMTLLDIRPESEICRLVDAICHVRTEDYDHSSNLYVHKTKDGTLINVKIDSSLIFLNNRKAEITIATNVTWEQKYKQEVEQLNATLLNAQSLAGLGYWRKNLDDEKTFWSPQMFKIFEIQPENFNGSLSQIESFFHPDDRYILQLDYFKIIFDTGLYNFQHRIITPDQKIKWLDSTIKLILNDKGEPISLEGVVIDITDKYNSVLEIKQKNKLINALNRFSSTLLLENRWEDALRVSFQIIGDAVDVDRVYYFENHEDESTKAKLCSQKIEWTREGEKPQINNPQLQNCPHEMFEDFFVSLYTGKNFSVITNHLHEGKLKDILVAQDIRSILIVPIFSNSYFKGFVGFDDCKKDRIWSKDEIIFLKTIASNLESFFDKRKVQVALTDKVVQLNTIIENLPGVAYRCKVQDNFPLVYLSDEFERLTGYSISEFISANKTCSFYDIFNELDRDRVIAILNQYNKNTSFDIECRLISKTGNEIWVKVNGRPIFENNNCDCYIDGIILDITNDKEKDRKLKEIAWSQSHLVRVPLANIMGLVDLVQHRFSDNKELNTYLELLFRSANDLDNVIKQNVIKASMN